MPFRLLCQSARDRLEEVFQVKITQPWNTKAPNVQGLIEQTGAPAASTRDHRSPLISSWWLKPWIGRATGLDECQIERWFQNRMNKLKKEGGTYVGEQTNATRMPWQKQQQKRMS